MTADDLSRIAMSPSLGSALARAGEFARREGHIEVMLEHMLLSLCEDPDAKLVMAASNIDGARLKGDVTGFLATVPKRGMPGQGTEPGVSFDLRRVLEAAAAAARGGRRREINGAIVLAAIVGDGRSPAAQMLQAQGLTFEGAIRALQRSPTPAAPSSSTEDILASARERVLSRTGLAARKVAPERGPKEAFAAEPAVPQDKSPKRDESEPMSGATRAPQESEAAPQVAAAPAPRPPAPRPAPPPPKPAPQTERSPPPPAPPPQVMPAPPPPPPIPASGPPPSWGPPPAAPDAAPPPRPAMPAAAAPPPMPPPIPQQSGGETPGRGRIGAAGPPPQWAEGPRRPMGVGASDAGAPGSLRSRLQERVGPGAGLPQQAGRRGPPQRAEIGQLVENIPRKMRVAVPVLVEVRVAKADVRALSDGLQGGGAAYQHEVTITKAMSVRLRAPDGGFFIETASPETQWIERAMLLSSDDFASWRWHVTPREKGKKRLQLVISARTVGADGLAAETALPDQVITVRVRTNYGKTVSHWVGWGVAALVGGLIAKFGEGLLDVGMQVVAKLTAG